MSKTIIKNARIIVFIALLLIMFCTSVFAVESTNSSSANLKMLGITPNDFSGFKENTTSYNVTVPNNVKSVNVYATAKESSAKVEGTGKLELEEGKNKAEVVVTANDGTTKTYTINIKRLKEGESSLTSNITDLDEGLGLTKLEIKGCTLEPSFSKDVHQYTVDVQEKVDSVEIVTETEPEDAKVIIKGNTKLIKGQNIVSIFVTDDNEKKVSTYQIYLNKQVANPNTISSHYNDENISINVKKWFTIILVLIIIICLFILKRIIRIKRALKRNKEERNNSIDKDFITRNKEILEENEQDDDDEEDDEEEVFSKSARQIRENYLKINNRIENESRRRSKKAKHGRHSK